MTLLHSTTLYINLPWLYLTPLDSTLFYKDSTSLHFTLHQSNMSLIDFPWLSITLLWVYFTLLDSTQRTLT